MIFILLRKCKKTASKLLEAEKKEEEDFENAIACCSVSINKTLFSCIGYKKNYFFYGARLIPSNFTSYKNIPVAGAVGPAFFLSFESKISLKYSTG